MKNPKKKHNFNINNNKVVVLFCLNRKVEKFSVIYKEIKDAILRFEVELCLLFMFQIEKRD